MVSLTQSANGTLFGGVGLDPAVRWWRVHFLKDADSSDLFSISEFQFAESIGGPNIATMGNAIAGGHAFTSVAERAFNNSPDTYAIYRDGRSGQPWIGQRFANPVLIAEVRILPRQLQAQANQAPHNFVVQKSRDGVGWQDIKEFNVGPTWVAATLRSFVL